jgi:hypothetical protein
MPGVILSVRLKADSWQLLVDEDLVREALDNMTDEMASEIENVACLQSDHGDVEIESIDVSVDHRL